MPPWRNWQTREPQKLVPERACGFESHRWHMKPGTRLQHFKGGTYEVVSLATCAVTLQLVVVYKAQDGQLWVRPLKQFDERVTRDGYDGPRFRVVD